MTNRYKTNFPLVILAKLVQKMGLRNFDAIGLNRYHTQLTDNSDKVSMIDHPVSHNGLSPWQKDGMRFHYDTHIDSQFL